jgi:CBS domain-containing protein
MLPFDPLFTTRILGTRVSTNLSTLVVIVLMSGGAVASLGRGTATVAEWSIGTLTVLASLFGAIALHAGARLMTYRTLGVSIRHVHLLSFGCIFQKGSLERSPRPGSIAGAVGMATLLLIPGTITLAIVVFEPGSGDREVPIAIALTLGAIVTIQLLPGLGLSGGDLLRSLVWYLTDNIIAGVRAAAAYAVLIGIALMGTGVGVIGLGGARPYLGIWAIVAGWQLSAAARLDVLRTQWLSLAETRTLAEILIPAARIPDSATIDTAIDLLVSAGAETPLLVMGSGGTLVGILRLDNLRAVRRSDWSHQTVGSIATPVDELPHLPADTFVLQTLDVLDSSDKPYIVVTAPDEPGRRLGAVTRAALTGRLHDRVPQ